jgi:hypothetical protein
MASSTYLIMGYTDVGPDEGIGVPARCDHAQPIKIARSALSLKFDAYTGIWREDRLLSDIGRSPTYPPLSGYIVLLPYLISNGLGFDKELTYAFTFLPFLFLGVASVYLALLVVESFRRISLPDVAIATLFLSGGFWYVAKSFKFEIAIPFFIVSGILALNQRKILSGICFGAAVCMKQIAILPAIPVFFYLCAERDCRQVIKWAAAAGLTIMVVYLPFIWGSGIENIYIAQFHNFNLLLIQPDTLVGYLYKALIALFDDPNGRVGLVLQMNWNKLLLLLCVLMSVVTVLRKKHQRTLGLLLTLMAICTLSYVAIGKFVNFGIYELVGIFLFMLWAMEAGHVAFGIIVMSIHSFLIYQWPVGLHKKEIMIVFLIILSAKMCWNSLIKEAGLKGKLPEKRGLSSERARHLISSS